MEHVLAKDGALRHAQKICRRLWIAIFDGCDPARETQLHIRAAGFKHVELEEFDAVELLQQFSLLNIDFHMIRSHISGTATK